MFDEFGHSRNKEFDDFLSNYMETIVPLDNLLLCINNDDSNDSFKRYRIAQCFNDAKKYIDIIDRDSKIWEISLGVTQTDYKSIDPFNKPVNHFQYEQTIPLNPNALVVEFDMQIHKNLDNTFKVTGITNLYDYASLMLSIRNENGHLYGQNESEIFGGKFNSGVFSQNGTGYSPGKYKASITLSIPSTQPKEFTNKAGIEYENLTGQYIDRNGIGPTLTYEMDFTI